MASSLEVRSPLLDHLVVEFAASLPRGLKIRGLIQKYLLKQAMRGILPAGVVRRRKRGFGVPTHHWFRHDLREMAYDVLLDTRARSRGYFRAEALRQYLDDHVQGRADHHDRLWALLMLELWHRTFIDARCPIRAPGA
jgi:asparagine synthase (glutamine-hydrolysing)